MQSSSLGDVFARLPVAVYRTSAEGRFLAGNEALVELLGASSFDDLARLEVASIYADPTRREWLLRRALANLPIPVEDLQIRRLDGGLRWVRVSSHTVRDDDGRALYFEGVMEDVTALHSADEQLRRSNELLATLTTMQTKFSAGVDVGELFDALLDDLLRATGSEYGFIAQLLHDDAGPFLRTWAMSDISWNDTTRALFAQYGPRGMEFHNLDTLFGTVITGAAPIISNDPLSDPRAAGRPGGHPPLTSFLGVPIRRGEEIMGMVALANRPGGFDDELIHFLSPLVTTVGSVIEATVADRLLQEARQRQKANEELYTSIVDRAADAIVSVTDGGRIVLANLSAHVLLGMRADSLVGERLVTFIPQRARRSSFSRGFAALASGTSIELLVRRADGTEHPIEATFVRGERQGVGVTTIIARDIAARLQLEDNLRLSRDIAESAARAKDELLAGMSHELRTPLNAVIGLSSVLRKELHGPLAPKQREYVEQIEGSGRHLLSVINDILDMAKAEAEKSAPRRTDEDPRALVSDAVGLIGELAVAKSIELTKNVPTGIPSISVDRLRARQVILNLLSNAVKFTASGGRIGVDAAVEPDTVAITVWDTGIGIAPDDLERIFQPFEQVDSSLARRHEGTGLGLALSRRLAEAQGGTLTVESTLGVGSRFTARFARSDLAVSTVGSATD